jgi:hypothetical protein
MSKKYLSKPIDRRRLLLSATATVAGLASLLSAQAQVVPVGPPRPVKQPAPQSLAKPVRLALIEALSGPLWQCR